MLENLMKSPVAWGILALITISSFTFGIYAFISGKKRKQLSFAYITNEVITSGKSAVSNKLSIQYDGEAINNLSVSKIYIWNSGNEVINKSDIVSGHPLSINALDSSFLDVQIIRTSEETNAFTITRTEKTQVDFDFDYIDPSDGIVVQVFQTGLSTDIIVDCKIKGGKIVSKKKHRQRLFYFKFQRIFLEQFYHLLLSESVFISAAFSLFTVVLFLDVFGLLSETSKLSIGANPTGNSINIAGLFVAILSTLMSYLFIRVTISLIRDYYPYGIPKKLRSQDDSMQNDLEH